MTADRFCGASVSEGRWVPVPLPLQALRLNYPLRTNCLSVTILDRLRNVLTFC